ncbi:alpha/beta hydrolase family protein [Brevibacillus ginsengisoli]|uniref:alpha/beta hydrolase family protein n=1 Tax=Brevibacillus ginsengisoli TaxID=363854 RepID=UPI003CFA8674
MQQAFELAIDNGLTIRGNVHTQEEGTKPHPVLIFCHGFKGFKDWGSFPYANEELSKQGIVSVRINFSRNGVGASLTDFDELEKFAVNTYAREVLDLEVLLDALLSDQLPFSEQMDKENIYIVGHSKGGGDAILFGSASDKIKGIITWNGIADVDLFDPKLRDEIANNGVGYIHNARTKQDMPIKQVVIDDVDQNEEKYNLIDKVSKLNKPLLIVQGEQDFARLVKGAGRLHEAAPTSELHWISTGDHTWNAKHPFAGSTSELEEAIRVTADFVKKHTSA